MNDSRSFMVYYPLFLFHISGPNQIDAERKWNPKITGRWEEPQVWDVSFHLKKKKMREQENRICGATNMIQCFVLWPSSCHKPFSKLIRHKAHSHAHTSKHRDARKTAGNTTNCRKCKVMRIVFFSLCASALTTWDPYTSFHMPKDITLVAAH